MKKDEMELEKLESAHRRMVEDIAKDEKELEKLRGEIAGIGKAA